MSALSELLATELKLVQSFIDCLVSEQDALRVGNVDALTEITTRKTGLADQLNSLETRRHAFLAQAGFSADRAGVMEWLQRNVEDRAAGKGWEQLMNLAGEARELNNLNGQLIAMRLQVTHQALATLTQQSQRSALYGANGQTTLLTGSRIIDAA